MTARARLGLLGAYVAATFLSFPHAIPGGSIDLGLAFAWVGPALLLAGLRALSPARAFTTAFLAGLAAHAAVLHWIYVVTVVYGEAPPIVGVVAPIGLAAYMAIHVGTFGWVAARLARARLDGPFALAAAWAALDLSRHHFLTGFPWAVLGYAQHRNPALLVLASYTGVVGLSFVTALGSFAGLGLLRAWRAGARPPREAWAALVAVALVHGAGFAALATDPAPGGERLRVAVLQGNVDQGVKWSPGFLEETLARYERLTREAAGKGARVVVWPETAVPGSIETDAGFRERLQNLAEETSTTLVVGAVGIELRKGEVHYFDSAYLFDTTGEIADRYDKSHLVPFGEYVPLRELLGTFVGAVARGIAPDNVTAGPGPRILSLPLAPAPGQLYDVAVPAGVPICYELLFPDLVRHFVLDGGRLLLAITNDAWYGRTGAPYQFLAITALRSAETRTWTARAANTGVSALIDDRGRVRAETPIFETTLLVEDVPLRSPGDAPSFYVRHGDVFGIGCAAATLLLLLAAWRRGRERSAA
ncbi:MAG TPA: apolipoprotein N-acyltransferase [Myxococcota bacterium]|jgi:apolipoprotein N-acyltransferase|nr:apolipoprotein N-acyltransferase [Myxococcota bacterium]